MAAEPARSVQGKVDSKLLLAALGEFPRAMVLRAELPQAQQWAFAFEALDYSKGLAKGTCATELPRFSKFVLTVEGAAKDRLACALLVLGRIDEAEKIAVKMGTESEKELSALGWGIAVGIAVEKGDFELALKRVRSAVAGTDPKRNFNSWAVAQADLEEMLRRTGKHEERLVVLRGLHEQTVKQKGPSAGLTLGYHNRLANALYEQSRFAEAEKEFKAMLVALSERPEKDVMQVQVIRDNLAKSIAAQGRKEEAEALDVSVVTMRKKTTETEESLDKRGQMGAWLYSQRRYAEAAAQWQIVYDEWKQRGGPEHKETLIAQNDLAVALKELGRNEESAVLLMEVIKIKGKHLPADDLTILESRNNLANALTGMGNYEAAAQEHRRVAEARRSVLGPKHSKTLDAYQNLAGDLQEIDQLAEAEKLAREVVAGRKETEGRESIKMVRSQVTLLSILGDAGKSEEAENGYRALVEACGQTIGAENPETLKVRHDFAVFLFHEGRTDESRKMCLANLEKCQKVLGGQHPQTEKSEILLSKLSLGPADLGQTTTKSSRSVLAKNLNEFGPDHRNTLRARVMLAHQLQRQKQHADAAKEYEMALSVYGRQNLLQTEEALDARNGQALNLRHMGKVAEAEALFRPLLQECISVLGEDNSISVASLGNLALTLRDQKRYEEALVLQKELVMRKASLHKEGHPNVITAYIQLSETLRQLGRMDEWRVYVQRAYDLSVKTVGEMHPQTQSIRGVLKDPSILDLVEKTPKEKQR